MSDENELRADLIKLQEQLKGLTAQLQEFEQTVASTYATRAYVQTYTEQMLGEIMPVQDQYTENTPLIGYIPLDVEKVLKHFRNIGGSYTQGDYRSILMSYDKAAKQGNINPYLAVAQMVKEADWGRSWWSQRPRRNPAGIGVTGEKSEKEQDKNSWAEREDGIWLKGYSFPSWEISAQAHIGHLLAYAYKNSELTDEQAYLVAVDPRARAIAASIRGTVKLLKNLDGKWAVPGVGYGKSIATLANALRT